ncbi:hypothetical protein CC99x_006035 [Candidatus Berkiella cookevillensis]|uniref:Uncharacterized protein n=1 Tax=Candidatus Berkiella cookevillensis TaxID=437022 RepID=A0A0Q9YH95_9GAMM|nr:hypothetical protein [Candidatus Berkiella cookevillensis]MCS5708464.1 hypothetical protein [Candidatus Berkiella cookevillensis]
MLGNKIKSQYIEALNSPNLDSSDLILMSIQLLEAELKVELVDVRNAYIQNDYSTAKQIINNLCANNIEDQRIAMLVIQKMLQVRDIPEENQSRRYFEARFSKALLGGLNERDFEALNHFLQTIRRLDTDGAFASQLPTADVMTLQDAVKVVNVVRGFGDDNPIVNGYRGPLRKKSPIVPRKDRDDTPIKEDDNSRAKPLSLNPGVMKASAPIPVDEQLDKALQGKTPDTFRIDRGVNDGFSATRADIPFVNSVSGTAFSLSVMLHFFLEENKGQEGLEAEVDSIIRAFMGHMCGKGYHSMGEMIEVLRDPSVQNLFAQHQIALNLDFNSDTTRDTFKAAASYSKTINIKRKFSEELVVQHQQKMEDGWNIQPIDAKQYLQKVRDKEAIIIDAPHTIINNGIFSHEYIGEICELVGNYNLAENVAFPPERLALFHTTAFIETEIQRDPDASEIEKRAEDDLYSMVYDEFYPSVLEKINASKDRFDALQDLIFNDARTTIMNYSNGNYDASVRAQIKDPFFLECLDYLDKIQTRFLENKVSHGQYKENADLGSIMIRALFTKMYNREMGQKIASIVDEVGNDIIKKKQYPRMSVHARDDRHTYMMMGAPACGKGVALGRAAILAEETHQVAWRDVCKINTDDHRAIVTQGQHLGQDTKIHAQLSNVESMIITSIANQKYNQKLKSGGAPHLLIDTVMPLMRKFNIGLEQDGQLHVFAVTAPVDESLKRMVARGQDTGRYVSSNYVIQAHQSVSNDLIKNLCSLTDAGKNFDFVILDTHVPLGSDPIVVMVGDTALKKLLIFDEDAAAYFYGKKNIDTNGRSMAQLYQDRPMMDNGYLDVFKASGFEVALPSQSINASSFISEPEPVSPTSNRQTLLLKFDQTKSVEIPSVKQTSGLAIDLKKTEEKKGPIIR